MVGEWCVFGAKKPMINLRRLERLKIQVKQKDLGPDPTNPSHHQPTIGALRAARGASRGFAIYCDPRISAGRVVSWCKGGAARTIVRIIARALCTAFGLRRGGSLRPGRETGRAPRRGEATLRRIAVTHSDF